MSEADDMRRSFSKNMPVVMKMTMFFLDLAQIACLGSGALRVVFLTLLTSIQTAQLWPALTAHSESSEHLNS